MARIRYPDGTEVFTRDEAPTVPERERRIAKKSGRSQRQRVEAGVKKIFQKGWDYVSGEGDDLDRALRHLGLKQDEPTEASVPHDPDFD